MATGGEINGQPIGVLGLYPCYLLCVLLVSLLTGIKDLGGVITRLEENDFPEHRWDDLGLKLHISQPKLDAVGADNPLNVKRCLKACLALWLRWNYDIYKYGLPTLPLLAAAIEEMGLRAVAVGINPGNIQSQSIYKNSIMHII